MTTDDDKPTLPPSLNMTPEEPPPEGETEDERLRCEHANARDERLNEHKKKQKARKHSVVEAMYSLPLTDRAKPQVFVTAFEQTYYQVERRKDDQPATAATIKKQLTDIALKCDNLIVHLGFRGRRREGKKLHPDVIQALGGPTAILGLFLLLDEVEAVAEREQVRALAALQAVAAKNKKKKTNPGDPMAKAMTEFAAFAYEKLTAKRIDQGTKSDAFESFLERIFGAYQIDANPQYCIRQFKEERRGEITK